MTFLRSIGELRQQGKSPPEIRRDWGRQRITTRRKQKPPLEPATGRNRERVWWIAGGWVWTSLNFKNSGAPVLGRPHRLPPGAPPGSHCEGQGKNLHASGKGRRKANRLRGNVIIFESSERSVLLNKACHKRNCLSEPYLPWKKLHETAPAQPRLPVSYEGRKRKPKKCFGRQA